MTVMEAIESRRSIRKYSERPVEREKLQQIAEAMRQGPSARNRQEWRFIFVEDAAKRAEISKASGIPWLSGAPVILAACGTFCEVMTNGHRSDTIDTSIAASFGMLEATELGLGTTWMAHYKEPEVREILDLPDSMSIVCLLSIGYSAEDGHPHDRKSAEDIVEYR